MSNDGVSDTRGDLLQAFEDVVRRVLKSHRFTDSEVELVLEAVPHGACDDQCIGCVEDWVGKGLDDFADRMSVSSDKFECSDVVVLVLESPHKYEIGKKVSAKNVQGPAKRTTGRNIRCYWEEVFRHKYLKYKVVLMNAVRYQCSLADAHDAMKGFNFCCPNTIPFKEIKEEIVCGCLTDEKKEFSNDLRRGLDRIYERSTGQVIIVNACTKGVCDKYYDVVTDIIIDSSRDKKRVKNIFLTTHPSSWRVKRNRKLVSLNDGGILCDDH